MPFYRFCLGQDCTPLDDDTIYKDREECNSKTFSPDYINIDDDGQYLLESCKDYTISTEGVCQVANKVDICFDRSEAERRQCQISIRGSVA